MRKPPKKVLFLGDNPALNLQVDSLVKTLTKKYPDSAVRFDFGHSVLADGKMATTNCYDLQSPANVQRLSEAYGFLASGCIVSLHCQQIFLGDLLDNVYCINLHPGFLPIGRGMYPYYWAMRNNVPAGATLHEMTTQVDSGPVLLQEQVRHDSSETLDGLYERIVAAELKILAEWLEKVMNNVRVEPRASERMVSWPLPLDDYEVRYSQEWKDDHQLTPEEIHVVNKLRALTFGEQANAWFYGNNNKKISVRVVLEEVVNEEEKQKD